MLRDAQIDVSRVFQFAAFSMLICVGLLFSIRAKTVTAPPHP